MLDPFLQLAPVISREAEVFGPDLYLGSHWPSHADGQAGGDLDHLTEGRFIFGVGVDGEIRQGVRSLRCPGRRRGARLDESLLVMRKTVEWQSLRVDEGASSEFDGVTMQPPPRQAGGPPIWCGGRSDAALRRIGRMTDGWMSYVITPEMFRQGLEKISAAAAEADRVFDRGFGLPMCCSHESTTPTKRHSTRRPFPSVNAMGWTSERLPNATARSVHRNASSKASCASTKRESVTSFSISWVPTSSATVRSSASLRKRCRSWLGCASHRRRPASPARNQVLRGDPVQTSCHDNARVPLPMSFAENFPRLRVPADAPGIPLSYGGREQACESGRNREKRQPGCNGTLPRRVAVAGSRWQSLAVGLNHGWRRLQNVADADYTRAATVAVDVRSNARE